MPISSMDANGRIETLAETHGSEEYEVVEVVGAVMSGGRSYVSYATLF